MNAMALSQEHPLKISEAKHAKSILRKLDSMRKERKNCDLIISVEGKQIHVNRDVMCAASDYFDAMFSHDTKEKQEGVVEMKEVTFCSVKKCIDFVYTGKIAVSFEECEELLHSASLMQLNEVCGKISPVLEIHLNLKSFFKVKRIAMKFLLEKLNTICDDFALNHLFSLAKQEQFNGLDMEYLSYLLSFKTSSGPRMEDSKLAISLQWIKADPENRQKYFDKITQVLDLTKITAGYVKYLVGEEALCRVSTAFSRLLCHESLATCEVAATGHPDLSQATSHHLMPSPNSLILFDDSSRLVQLYRPSENQLTCITNYPDDVLGYFTACIMKDDLLVFAHEKKVFHVSITSSNPIWRRLDDMIHDHGLRLCCTVSGSTVYVGGVFLIERCKILEGGKWEDIDVGTNRCFKSTLASYNGLIFVIGGVDFGGNSMNTVRKYSPPSLTWFSVPPMNVARAHPAAVVYGRKLYVAGGKDYNTGTYLSDFEMYDNDLEQWTVLPSLKTPHFLFSLCIVGSQIFATNSPYMGKAIEVYDFSVKKWTPYEIAPNLEIYRLATVSAYIPN